MLRKIVLFQGANASTPAQHGLWETDGTAVGTSELAPIAGADASGLTPSNLTVYNGEVLFEGVNASGQFGLWTTDGTPGNTTEVTGITDINDKTVSDLTPNNLIVLNGRVLFNGTDSAGKAGLWVTNGTATGTQELVAGTASGGLNPTGLALFKNEVLFNGVASGTLHGLWMTNGTTGGTTELTPIAGVATTGLGFNPSDMTAFGADVLLAGTDTNGHVGLWETDGTASGTQELVAGAASVGLNPADLTVLGAIALFSGVDVSGHVGLWETNGTAGGTAELTGITDINGHLVSKFTSSVSDSVQRRSAVQRNQFERLPRIVGNERQRGRHSRDLRGRGRPGRIGPFRLRNLQRRGAVQRQRRERQSSVVEDGWYGRRNSRTGGRRGFADDGVGSS